MLPIKKLPPLTPQQGELYCPRKGDPFPAIISVMQCEQLHTNNPDTCARHNCKNNVIAKQEIEIIKKKKDEVEDIKSTKRQRKKVSEGWGHGP